MARIDDDFIDHLHSRIFSSFARKGFNDQQKSFIKTGKVVRYNRNSGSGEILFDDGGSIFFGNGSFDSGWPVRPPQVGDFVDVRLSDINSSVPVYVRLRNEKTSHKPTTIKENDHVHCEGKDWFFWDEVQADRLGPYSSEIEARKALNQYAKSL